MHKLIYCIGLLWGTFLYASMLSPTDLDALYEAKGSSPKTAKMLEQRMPMVSRLQAINVLKNMREPIFWGEKAIFPSDTWRLRANLGDLEVIQEIYAAYLSGPDEDAKARTFATGIGRINYPALVSIMGRDLSQHREKVKLGMGGFSWEAYEVPYGNAYMIRSLLEYSDYFPTSVVSWAGDLRLRHKEYRPDLYLAEIRAFWAENAVRIEAGEYDLVRPPGEVSKPTEEPSPPATPAPSPAEPAPELVKSSIAAAIPTSAAEPAPAVKTNPLWWIVGLVILAVGVVFVSCKKKPRA